MTAAKIFLNLQKLLRQIIKLILIKILKLYLQILLKNQKLQMEQANEKNLILLIKNQYIIFNSKGFWGFGVLGFSLWISGC